MKKNLFLSDIHLGTDICQAKELLKFFKSLETKDDYDIENLYLVGDIIDFLNMKFRNRWTKEHTTVIQKMLRMSRKGVKIYFLPGNHETNAMNIIDGWNFGNIFVGSKLIHEINGKRCLIFHGHQYDGFAQTAPWLYWVGDNAYSFALFVNKWFNRIRKIFGFKYWSLSHYLRSKVKSVIKFINQFNHLIVKDCQNENIDIVIYGHTHTPDICGIENIKVINCGCSTELTTCVIEENGVFMLFDYHKNKVIKKNILK